MKLVFKQKMFSWFDSYDVFDGYDNSVVYTVKGQLALGHCFKIYDAYGSEVGFIRQKLFSFLPKYEIYYGPNYIGCIKREISFLKPKFSIDFNGWRIDGDFFEWNYRILDFNGNEIAAITKELFNWTDTYSINVYEQKDALNALMLVIAIDADKCSRNNR